MKKWKIVLPIIIMIGIMSIVGIFAFGGASTNSAKNTSINNTVFSVDGPAQPQTDYDGMYKVLIPVHKTVPLAQKIYFTYVPYVNGTPEPGLFCIVPQGVDTTHTFMLEVDDGDDTNWDALDIIAWNNESCTVMLQKVHILLPVNSSS
jgi:hypothetical protein